MSSRRISFRFKLILSLILLLLPLIAGDVFFHYQHFRVISGLALNTQVDAARDLAQTTDLFVDRTVAVQRAVGQALAKSHWHSDQVRQKYVESVLASTPPLLYIAFANPSGKIVESVPSSMVGHSITDTSLFQQIRSGAKWAASGTEIDRMCAKCKFTIATAIRDRRGALLGMIVSGVNEKRLLPVLRAGLSRNARLVLLDRRGHLAFTNNLPNIASEEQEWSRHPFVREALLGKRQSVQQLSLPGQPALTGAMVPVPSLGWAAGAFAPREEVVGPVREMVMKDIAVTVMILAFTFLIGSIIARQMTAPIEHLSGAAERLGRGELDARAPVVGTTELSMLAHTMNQMAESVQQAYERERRIATVLQQRMLPHVPARVGKMEIATGYFPALEEAELGGDFYDVMLLPDGLLGLVIADVSGKGLTAAVHTAMAKYMLEGYACEDPSPAGTLRKLNRAIGTFRQDDDSETFITTFFAAVDPSSGLVTYANAGHPSPLLRRDDSSVEWLNAANGLPLGVAGDTEYSNSQVTLSEGDSLILYTDGVIEGRSGDKWFGMEELTSLVGNLDASADELVHDIYQAVSEFAGGNVQDDVALVAIRMRAESNR